MCELFGVCSKRNITINKYLNKFYSHCEQHPHGWGLAIMHTNKSLIEKQPIKASDSKKLQEILKNQIIVKNAFAHIRLATMGSKDAVNCHPFSYKDNTGRTWTLIHNGTIFEYDDLNSYMTQQTGETDSERILLYITDKINEEQIKQNRPLNHNELFDLIETIIISLSKGNKLNIMLFDGKFMYAHTNYKKSLYILEKQDSVFISTQPLSDEDWNELAINHVISITDGRIYKTGKKHPYNYEITDEHLKFILEHMATDIKSKLTNNFDDYISEYQS